MLIQSKKNRTSFYLPFLLGSIGTGMCIGNSLVGAKFVVVFYIAINNVMKLACYPKNRPPQSLGKIRAIFNGTTAIPLMSTPMKFFRFWALKEVRDRYSVRSLVALWAQINTSATNTSTTR